MMVLKRIYKGQDYTIGHIYVDGEYICDTIEDKDRGLTDKMSEQEIAKMKVASKTAIPTGTYKLTLDIVSPKFIQKAYYYNFCKGKLPRLIGVKGFDGVLIHKGNTQKDSAGCIIVGYNKVKGQVVDSQKAFEKLYKIILARGIKEITVQ